MSTIQVKKNGGPYTKKEQETRRDKVYKLYFDFGYSARKIANTLNVNRNTINSDIDYLYGNVEKNRSVVDSGKKVIIGIERLEVQRSRLREQLDKTELFKDKVLIERLIYDLDSKIINTNLRLTESVQRLFDYSTDRINEWLKNKKMDERYMTVFDRISVSEKASEKIKKIIDEDRKRIS